MRPPISAESSAMPAIPKAPYRNAYTGALDALANFWFKRIECVDLGERERSECSLEMNAEFALFHCLKPRGIINERSCVDGMFEDGFDFGFRVAALLTREPFDAEAPLRLLLDELVAVVQERRKDSVPEEGQQ